MNRHFFMLPLSVAVLLGGCVTTPTAPTVMSLPGSQKSFEQFQDDEANCKQYAYGTVAPAGKAAADNAASSAVVGTVIGAAAGALIGEASGQPGSGAAIGAGTGLLLGSASGSDAAYGSSYDLQRRYDMAYVQCMYARGNQVPGHMVSRQSASPRYSYPPPNTPPPAGVR